MNVREAALSVLAGAYLPTEDSATGTSSQGGEVRASYSELCEILGPHTSEGDRYKTSTEWVMKGADGQIVTVYDWKETNLYDDPSAPTPEQLRQREYVDWHIGAKSAAVSSTLKVWLDERLTALRTRQR